MFQVAFAVDHVFQRNTAACAFVVHFELFLFLFLALAGLRWFFDQLMFVIEVVAHNNWLFVIFLEIGHPYCFGFYATAMADVFAIENESTILDELFHLLFIFHVKHKNLVLAMRYGLLICVVHDSLFILCQVLFLFKFSLVFKDGKIDFSFRRFILVFILIFVFFSIGCKLFLFTCCFCFLIFKLFYNLFVRRHDGCNFDDFTFVSHEVWFIELDFGLLNPLFSTFLAAKITFI